MLVLVGLAARTGWRLGASAFLLRLVGALIGLVLGLELAGTVKDAALSPTAQLLLAVSCGVGGALVGAALGGRVGIAAARALADTHLRVLDRILGAVARALLALLACALAGALVAVGPRTWSGTVRNSALLSRPGDVPLAGPLFSAVVERVRRVAPADLACLVPAADPQGPPDHAMRQLLDGASPATVRQRPPVPDRGFSDQSGRGRLSTGGCVP